MVGMQSFRAFPGLTRECPYLHLPTMSHGYSTDTPRVKPGKARKDCIPTMRLFTSSDGRDSPDGASRTILEFLRVTRKQGPGKKRSEYELTGKNNLPEHQTISPEQNPGMSAHYPEAYPGRQ